MFFGSENDKPAPNKAPKNLGKRAKLKARKQHRAAPPAAAAREEAPPRDTPDPYLVLEMRDMVSALCDDALQRRRADEGRDAKLDQILRLLQATPPPVKTTES